MNQNVPTLRIIIIVLCKATISFAILWPFGSFAQTQLHGVFVNASAVEMVENKGVFGGALGQSVVVFFPI